MSSDGSAPQTAPETAPQTASQEGSVAAGKDRGPGKSLRARGPRAISRLAAIQALYQMEIAQTDAGLVIDEFVQFRFDGDQATKLYSGADRGFFRKLVTDVVRHQRELDPVIDAQLASGWRLGRIDAILRAILRAATVELRYYDDVPVKVVINEYIEVSREFFEADEPKVVNGVLDALGKKLRPVQTAPGS
ncbi:MAG: transcription antitermination factor NusB [Pseudomonadota bacterium]